MSWEKIEDYLFHRYDVEGEDKELSDLMEEHDKEIRAKAITEFAEKLKEKSTFLKSLENDYYGYVSEDEIDEIAEQIKKEV